MMSFEAVAIKLGLNNPAPALRETWAASQMVFEHERTRFADPPQLDEACRVLGMPEGFVEGVLKARQDLPAEEALFRYVWHCRWLLSELDSGWPVMGAGFPVIRPDASPAAGMGYALVFLDLFRTAQHRFRERGVPDDVALDTLRDFTRWVEDFRQAHGVWGLWNLGWLQHHLRARLFALGRLQFRMEKFEFDFHGWRQRSTGRVRLLAGDGMMFRPDGLFADADRQTHPAPGSWKAGYAEDGNTVRGMPVDPRGLVIREPVTLPRSDWVRVLGKGDATVGIHIPGGSPMDFEACGRSLSGVRAFFGSHVPEHPVTAMTCSSWLLDPQFEGRLPESSNVVRVLRELYLHPLPGATDYALFERVFANRRPGENEPETGMTTLQKSVMKAVRSGVTWRAGGAVLFPDEVVDWGKQAYRVVR